MSSHSNPKWKNVGLWVVSFPVALMFLFTGGMKLMGAEMHVQGFESWGYPLWFMYVIGVAEVLGAVGLLVPRLSSYAALGLGVVMMGATATHVAAGEYNMLLMPLMFLGLSILIAWGRWSRLVLPRFLRSGSPV